MFRKIILVVFLSSWLVSACGVSTGSAPATSAPPARLTPDTSTPESPTSEPSPTTIPVVTVDQLGVVDPSIISAFSGAKITRESDGTYSVSAVSYNQETKVTASYKIDEKTFSINSEIKNAYAPATVNAVDGRGNKVTLIWDLEHGAWRVPFTMVDNSDFSKIDQIPFIPEGDQKIVAGSALLYFKDHPPFNIANVESYKKYGGNSLQFIYDKDGKWALLKAKGNDHKNVTPDDATMKVTPFWFYQKINGVRQNEPLVVVLDPSDPKNPQVNEYKIISAIDGYFNRDITKLSEFDKKNMMRAYYGQAGFAPPYLVLYGDAQYQKNHPLLASLLALPGNDPRVLSVTVGGISYSIKKMTLMDELSPTNNLIETQAFSTSLPPEIQTMRFLFAVGASR